MDAVEFVQRARVETLGEVYRQTPQEIARGETRVRSAIRRVARSAPMILDERELQIILGFEEAFVYLALADGEAFPDQNAETNLLKFKHGGDRTLLTRAKLICAVIRTVVEEPWTDAIPKYLAVLTNAVGVAAKKDGFILFTDRVIIDRFTRDKSFGPVLREQALNLYAMAEKYGNRQRLNIGGSHG